MAANFPDNAEAHYALGRCYDEKGRTCDAISEYSEVLNLNPEHVQAHIRLAVIYSIVGGKVSASSHLVKARKIDPNAIFDFHVLLLELYNMGD